MDFTIYKTQIVNSRRTFRAPFKVTSMCFSPHNDLIALGSKGGDVMLKRTTWKMIWKTNVSTAPAIGAETKSDTSVTALHFSPDGRFIATATSRGIIHLLDVESGKIRYSVKAASDSITKLIWENVREKPFIDKYGEYRTDSKNSEKVEAALELARTTPDCSKEDIGFVYQRLDEDGSSFKHDENQRENLEKQLISTHTYCQSLRNTVLLAIDSNPKIIVLIAGVFPFMEIDVNDILEQANQGMVMWYDSAHYNSAFDGVSFIATTYGPYVKGDGKFEAPGTDPDRSGQGCQTLMFNVRVRIDDFLWEAALRYIRMLYGFNLYSVSLDTTKRNWKTQVTTLHSLFDTKTKAVKIGDVLLEMLLSGATDSAGEGFLERGFGTDGLEGIKNFASKHMPEVSRLVRGQLASASRNMSFQRCEFMHALKKYEQRTKLDEDEDYLYRTDEPEHTKAINPWLTALETKTALLEAKTRQLGIQCLTMMQELGHLAKWISITKPFAKTMKVNSLMKIKRMDIAKVLKYIVQNFIPDQETAKMLERRLFDLEGLVKEQEKKDKEEGFDEDAFLVKCESKAEAEHKKIQDKYETFSLDHLRPEPLPVRPGEDVDNSENDPTTLMEGLSTNSEDEESEDPSVDLDRVGSFFERELSAKALEVLPKCNEKLHPEVGKKNVYVNSEEVRKMGLVSVLEELAKELSSPQGIQSYKPQLKPKLNYLYGISSGANHQGFLDVSISDVTPTNFKSDDFNRFDGMGRSIQVFVVEKNSLNSVVIAPDCDMDDKTIERDVKRHVEAMTRCFKFEEKTISRVETGNEENVGNQNDPPNDEEAMEVDENELRIDVDVELVQPDYDTLMEYSQVLPLRYGEFVMVGKFKSNQEGSGLMTRIMRTQSAYPHHYGHEDLLAVNCQYDGKAEVSIDKIVVQPTTALVAFLHDECSRITLGDMKPEVRMVDSEMRVVRKTFRDYQRRRERYRRNMGIVNFSDVQYDVLVQEALDSGRDLTDNEEEDDYQEEEEEDNSNLLANDTFDAAPNQQNEHNVSGGSGDSGSR